jgi:hypothetical protein
VSEAAIEPIELECPCGSTGVGQGRRFLFLTTCGVVECKRPSWRKFEVLKLIVQFECK